MSDDKKTALIRDAQAILTDAVSDVITNDEAIRRLLALLDGSRARDALGGRLKPPEL